MSLNAEEADKYVRAVRARLLADPEVSPAAKTVIRGEIDISTTPGAPEAGA